MPEACDPAGPMTLLEKIWQAHLVQRIDARTDLIYIDRHLINEVTSPQAFEGLRQSGRTVRRPEATIAVADHNVPTADRHQPIADAQSRLQLETLERNVGEFGVPYVPFRDRRQGIVHVVAPEQGLTLPGMTVVCGDSHTSTHGALGALAFGIGTSEVEHVLATQTLMQARPKSMRVRLIGRPPPIISAKDVILWTIGHIGVSGGAGHVIEFAGSFIEELGMSGRLTICNMSIEAGARAGLVAPDRTTIEYVRGRPFSPTGDALRHAEKYWLQLASDPDATFDREISLDVSGLAPLVSWGTTPEDVVSIEDRVPDPAMFSDEERRRAVRRKLDYMGLTPGVAMQSIELDAVFIGSCTNGRIEDLRTVADLVAGRRVADGVRALVVPGSSEVKAQAEAEGLDRILVRAGFDWRESGCSMCLGMNEDRLRPGERCASTSNRNFEGRQGPGGRTHLVSPATAAASAIAGRLADPRTSMP